MVAHLARVSAEAQSPDQLLDYVRAVSGMKSEMVGPYLLHHADGYGVLVGYSKDTPGTALDEAVADTIKLPFVRNLTVIAHRKPDLAPASAKVTEDNYWFLRLPQKNQSQKLRNMLKRAAQDISITESAGANAWTGAHGRLASILCSRKKATLAEGSEYIFGQLGNYLANSPDTRLYSAYSADGTLAGCAIGDFSALSTAFYMFAFRKPDAPPGTADALLAAIVREASERGHTLLNLGLGIDAGVTFFKKKWGATPDLPFVETSWNISRKSTSWLGKLLGK